MKLIGISIVSLIAVCGVVFGAVKLAGGLGDSGELSTECNSGQHAAHEVNIKSNSFEPAYIKAARCDTMTIKNLDARGRLIAFGKHDQHIAYDGVSERYLLKNEEFTITLDQTGAFLVHDHNQEEVQATFKVGAAN